MSDLINRYATIEALTDAEKMLKRVLDDVDVVGSEREKYAWGLGLIKSCEYDIRNLPFAQPKQKWIPITSRPMTEDERKEWSEKLGYNIDDDEAVIYGNLPDDGQSVLIYKEYSKTVDIDTFCDDGDGCYFEDNGDMDGITYWMPLPEKPKGE